MAETLIGIKPLHERILVGIYDDGETHMMLGGRKFYLLGDSMAGMERDLHSKHPGVRPRWAIVLSVSDKVQEHGDVKLGDKVLLDELKWSRGMKAPLPGETTGTVWSIPLEDVLLVGDTDESFSDIDKQQIAKLYPDWESWTAAEV